MRSRLVVLLLLAGCAHTPAEKTGSDLYEGPPLTAFATEIPAGSAAEALARGDAAYAQGELDHALFLYIQALDLQPNSVDALLRVGSVHQRRDNSALASEAYRRALLLQPANEAALENLGLLRLAGRDLEGAADLLNQVTELNTQRWRSLNGLGVIADLNGEHDTAIGWFQRALQVQPRAPQVLNNLGYSHYLADRPKDAEGYFHEVLSIEPGHPLATRNLALLLSRAGKNQQALQRLRTVLPEHQALNDLGYLKLLDGDYAVAISLFQQAIEVSPSYYPLAEQNLRRARQLEVQPARQSQRLASTPARPDPDLVVTQPPAKVASPAGVLPSADNAPAPGIVSHAALAEPLPIATSDLPMYLKRWVDADILNVRDDSASDAATIDKIRRGRVVRILRQDGQWAYVRYWEYQDGSVNTREGWVHANYLSDTAERA